MATTGFFIEELSSELYFLVSQLISFSDFPRPYISAVSNQLIPFSMLALYAPARSLSV